MKYCKKCKLAAKETDTHCTKCGTAVSSFGSSKPAGEATKPASAAPPRPSTVAPARPATAAQARPTTTAPPKPMAGASPKPPTATPSKTETYTLGGEVQRLEQIKDQNLRWGRGLGLLSLLIALGILFILYQVYSKTVLAYAVIDNIQIAQDPIAENQLTISFDVKTPGKVAFDRRSGKGHTEKIDLIAKTEGHKTVWAWPSDPKTGIDLSVLYRSGWFRASKTSHFDVTRDGTAVDVVFLIDITSSMGNYLETLKQKCLDFADEVKRQGLDCRLGLVGFGDVDYNEPILAFDPSTPTKFQENVATLELTNGGDAPESSVEALEKALDMEFRPHTRVCFVHITDESCKSRERIPKLVATLKGRSIVTYVVSQNRLRATYKPLCVNGGTFFDLRDSSFAAILNEIAKSIVNTIKSD